jgi:hypothetical protein
MNPLAITATLPSPFTIREHIRALNRELALARRLFAVSVLAHSRADDSLDPTVSSAAAALAGDGSPDAVVDGGSADAR